MVYKTKSQLLRVYDVVAVYVNLAHSFVKIWCKTIELCGDYVQRRDG